MDHDSQTVVDYNDTLRKVHIPLALLQSAG